MLVQLDKFNLVRAVQIHRKVLPTAKMRPTFYLVSARCYSTLLQLFNLVAVIWAAGVLRRLENRTRAS